MAIERLPKHLAAALGAVILSLWVAGCATNQQETDSRFFEEWKARVPESRPYSPPPKSHLRDAMEAEERKRAAGEEDVLLGPIEKPLPTRKVTLKMSDIDVSVLLRALARIANQNIILSEKVAGKVNINISDAPWDQVFKSLLLTNGLTYTWEGDIIRVMTLQDMESELRRESQRNELSKAVPLTTRVVKISYAEASKMSANLGQFLSVGKDGKPLGSVLVDDHTNSLIIQAVPEDLRRMIKVVDQLDRPTSQILIEAFIVETTNDTARALGIQWGGVALKSSSGKNYWVGPDNVTFDGQESLFDPDTGQPLQYLWPIGNIANFPVPLPDGNGLSLGFMFQNIGDSLLTFQLQALQEEGKLNILSSPSITTLENQIAVIESGSRIPIQTVENGEVNIEYVQATLRLEVTPNVIDNETLKLKILTNKDEPDFSRTVAGNPTIITKKAETNVILFNGQTTVIGGLSRESSSAADQGIPYLKDVPGLGWLFGSRARNQGLEEVLIFITPFIMEEKPAASIESSSRQPTTGNITP